MKPTARGSMSSPAGDSVLWQAAKYEVLSEGRMVRVYRRGERATPLFSADADQLPEALARARKLEADALNADQSMRGKTRLEKGDGGWFVHRDYPSGLSQQIAWRKTKVEAARFARLADAGLAPDTA